MNRSILVESWKSKTIKQIPDGWSAEDYRALLDLLELGDVPPAEIRDYELLALSDLERPEAANIVLTYLLSDKLTAGQIQNVAHELEDEKLWEEYADIALQKYFFLATELLYEAFNGGFPQPKAQLINVVLSPVAPTTAEQLSNLSAADVLRLLATGFDEHSVMYRLFEEQLKGGAFPDAEGIVWQHSIRMPSPNTFEISLISSEYWLEDFDAPASFKVSFVVD